MSSAGRSARERAAVAVGVGVDSADLLVQRDELLGRDRARPAAPSARTGRRRCRRSAGRADCRSRRQCCPRPRWPDRHRHSACRSGCSPGRRPVPRAARQLLRGAPTGASAPVSLLMTSVRHVVARLVVEAECVVPGLAAAVIEMSVDRGLLGVDLRLSEAAHQRRPLRAGIGIDQQHAVDHLQAGGDRVGVVAARLDAVEQTGEDRRRRCSAGSSRPSSRCPSCT